MGSRSTDDLHPLLKPKAESFLVRCKEAGINAFITCTYRSTKEQDELYAIGRRDTGGKIVTNAKGGQSKHNYYEGRPAAKAFDFAIKGKDGHLNWYTDSPEWKKALEIGQGLGLVSGGTFKFKDFAHMELKE